MRNFQPSMENSKQTFESFDTRSGKRKTYQLLKRGIGMPPDKPVFPASRTRGAWRSDFIPVVPFFFPRPFSPGALFSVLIIYYIGRRAE